MLMGAPTVVAYALAASSGWVLTLVRPTYGALLPWIVRTPQELTTTYAASGLIESVTIFLGPVLVGAVLAYADERSVSGPGLAFIVLGALLLVGTRSPTSREAIRRRTAKPATGRNTPAARRGAAAVAISGEPAPINPALNPGKSRAR